MCPIARLPLRLGSLLALSFVLPVAVPPARAQSQTCNQLISAPGAQTAGITISAPGIYCLATDVIMAASFTAGNAITITANYVTLDLNGHKVHGAAAGVAALAVGIHAANRRNVTVKNGTVWGFYEGIKLDASSASTLTGYVVEGVRAELNRRVGIFVAGANSIVRHNVVANTGLPDPALGNPVGIQLVSQGGRVLNNDVLTVTSALFVGLEGIGIYVLSAADYLVLGNRITATVFGVSFSEEPPATGKYRDNLTSGVVAPFSGGTDAGGNN